MLLQQHIVAKWRQILHYFIGICRIGLLVTVLSSSALQASERDSLRQVLLKNTLSDTVRALVLERLVGFSMEAQPDTALVYAWQLHIIAENNTTDKHLMLIALNALVNGYIHYDKPDKMLKYGFQLLHLSSELRDTAYLARAFYAIGHASGQLFTKNDIKENTSALQYLRQALEIAEERRDTTLMAQCFNAIGRIYRKEEQFDSAMVYHSQALTLATKVKLSVQQGWAFHSLAICYENKGNRSKALEYALEGLHYREQVGNAVVTAFSFSLVARLYQQSGNLRQALLYAERGLALAKSVDFRTAQYQALERIAQIHEALGNYREALFYQRRFASVRDSLAVLERTEDLRSLQAELKLIHSERERTLLLNEQEAQGLALQRQQILVGVMTLAFILLVFAVLLLLREQRKQNFQRQEITKLKRILDESSDYVVMSEIASGNVLYMNKAYLSLINAQTPPTTLSELLHRVYEPATAETVLTTHLPLVLKHERLSGETTLLDHNGTQISVLHTTICHYDEKGDAILVSSVMRDISERKRAEEALLESEELANSIINNLPLGLAMYDANGVLRRMNDELVRILQLPDSTYGLHVYNILEDPFAKEHLGIAIRRVLSGEIIQQEVWRDYERNKGWITRKDKRCLDEVLFPLKDGNGEVTSFVLLAGDITEKKQSENALRESERHLQSLVSSIDDIVFELNASQQRFTNVWCADSAMLFMPQKEFLGKTIAETLGDDFANLVNPSIEKAMKTGRTQRIEYETPNTVNQASRWFEAKIVFLDQHEQQMATYTMQVSDISERKKAEKALNESLTRWQQLFDILPVGVSVIDKNGLILDTNPALQKILQLTEEDFIAKIHEQRQYLTSHNELMSAKDFPSYRAFHENRTIRDVEICVVTENGNKIWLNTSAAPFSDDKVVIVTTDITERKRAEQLQLVTLSMVASKTTNAVVITDAEYRITWVNEGYTRLTEYSLDEVLGEEPECSAQQSKIDQLTMERMRRAVTERISFEGEVMNYSKSGQLYWVYIKTDPFFDDDGTLAGFVSIKTDITERKHTEQALKDSEERYRLIFECNNEGMIQTHPDGRIEAVNSAACSIFGRSKEELSRMSRENIVDMSDPRLSSILQERETVGYVQGELNFVRGDGTIFPGEFSSSVYVDSKGSQHIIVFLRDVSERKRAEKALRQSEGNLRALFESSIQAYYLIDKNYSVLSFNNVARDIVKSYFGRTLVMGDSILDYTIPDEFMSNFHRALQGEWVTDDGVAEFPNNQRRFFEAIYSPVYDDKNELIGVSYNMLDITERKELQTQVTEYSTRLQSIIVSMMDGVILLNEQRTISLTNPAAEAIFGYASEDLFSQPLTLLLPEGVLELHDQHIENFLHNAPSGVPRHKSHIVQGRHKSGHLFPMEASIAHFTVEGRLFLLAVVRDITRRLETEEEILELNRTLTQRVEERTAELVKLNKEKDEFLGIAAHDLKNPLAAIRSSAQIIEECFMSGEAINFAEYTDSIIATSDEMLDIITNFLDIELIENGKLGLALERVPHTIVQKAVTSHQRRARAKGITIHYEEPTVPISIIADKVAFRQVLDNLLSNAVKFSPRSKDIYVRIEERQTQHAPNISFNKSQDRCLRIKIQDEGPGIGINEQDKLFTKFSRLSAKPTGEEGSTGLGLSIVKKLVEMMNGRVWCESEKGEGATFIVELPVL